MALSDFAQKVINKGTIYHNEDGQMIYAIADSSLLGYSGEEIKPGEDFTVLTVMEPDSEFEENILFTYTKSDLKVLLYALRETLNS